MTQEYYIKHVKSFVNDTLYADMKLQYEFFLKHMPNEGSLLDVASSQGRDSLFFQSLGYDVTVVENDKKTILKEKDLKIENVVESTVENIDFQNQFDAVWASSNLIHVATNKLNLAFKKCARALKKNGILYVAFKYGHFDGKKNDKYYVDLKEDSINNYLKDTDLEVVEITLTKNENDRQDKWFNAILMKV